MILTNLWLNLFIFKALKYPDKNNGINQGIKVEKKHTFNYADVVRGSLILDISNDPNRDDLYKDIRKGKIPQSIEMKDFLKRLKKHSQMGFHNPAFNLSVEDLSNFKHSYFYEDKDNHKEFLLFYTNSLSALSRTVLRDENSFRKLLVRLSYTHRDSSSYYSNLLNVRHNTEKKKVSSQKKVLGVKYELSHKGIELKQKLPQFSTTDVLKIMNCDYFREQALNQVFRHVYSININKPIIKELLLDIKSNFNSPKYKDITPRKYAKKSYSESKKDLETWVKKQIPLYKLYLSVLKYSSLYDATKYRRVKKESFKDYLLRKGFPVESHKKAYEMRKYSTSKVNKEIAHVVNHYPQFFDLWISSLSSEDYNRIFNSYY